ncbi:PREDICTED: probable sugar phosphate/phosphate translocator At2g25520 [Ipomoea nil]|uniref:probable sugar phosphate/phosphate translocator At2g25520 n=1 Tax=Ipomoea nil TaxID=35883 RepID=UPI000900A875|nr:PREDICTED: probable sugar phosphate/phosphate translocator At2g25520 [Ipomoea nil]
MGKGAALYDGVVKKIILSYTYVAIWIFLSFTVIVYNKYILDRKLYNWPFPISLTMIHMAFCSSLAFFLVRVAGVVHLPAATLSRRVCLTCIVPIGALYSLSLWFSNSAYIYLSVSFTQMLKALMPVAVYTIGILLNKDSYKPSTMVNMVSISVGVVAVAAYGEAKYDSWGVFLQLMAVGFEATRLVMIQILLTSKGISLNPITSLYYVAPSCLVFLCIPWVLVELPLLRESSGGFRFDFVVFGTNSLCAFALNLAVFLLVGKTSALTMNVGGVVKDWLLIAFSWSVIKDSVTPVNLLGYGVAFLGVGYYNHSKLQALKAKEAQKKAQQGDDESGRLLSDRDESGGDGWGKKGDAQA